MKKPPFQADDPEQAMQNFNEALRTVLSVSKEDLKKDAGFKAAIRTVRGKKRRAKKKAKQAESFRGEKTW